ncbi:MAG: hypothetical protein H5U40_18855 [Polyangiaceae bacterium]|nr:hypothetical protein [Polyangiaceae bacterium]
MTTVRPDEVVRTPSGRRDRLEKRATAIEAASLGLPIGVQVVARPYEEHVALAAMSVIEAQAREHEGFPRTPIAPRRA